MSCMDGMFLWLPLNLGYNFGDHVQIEESRARVSEKSTEMHNTVVEAHEKSKNLEKELKALNKELQPLLKEKEAAERQKTEASSFYAKKELDVRDVEDRMRAEGRTQVIPNTSNTPQLMISESPLFQFDFA